jgi:3'-phosphoadenosine 5'-phosphosulfate sulfotransferase (PAPS reductase)/FAD synthetase
MGLKFETSEESCEYVRSCTDKVIVSFSRGKDSIGSYLQCRKYWDKDNIFLVHLGLVNEDGKELGFIEEYLQYLEALWGVHIFRLWHPAFIQMRYYRIYQPPERNPLIDHLILEKKLVLQGEAGDKMGKIAHLVDAYQAVGIRQDDNLTRRTAISANGSVFGDERRFFPVWDWSQKKLLDEIEQAGVELPKDYIWFGRSYEGIGKKEVLAVKQHAPADYERLRFLYPFIEMCPFVIEKRAQFLERMPHPDDYNDLIEEVRNVRNKEGAWHRYKSAKNLHY